MTAPVNPNPVPLAQKLWTLIRKKKEAIIVVGSGELQFGFPADQYAVLELLVVAHNASLALPKQEEHCHEFEGDGGFCRCGETVASLLEKVRQSLRETLTASKAEDGQTQKSLSLVLDEIERGMYDYSENDSIRIGRLIYTRNKLVKALRYMRQHALRPKLTSQFDEELIQLLTSPAETKKDL